MTIPFRVFTNWLAFGALAVAIVKRHGLPKFNKTYLQQITLDDNTQTLPYLGIVAVASGGSFIFYMPLIIHAWVEVSPHFKAMLEKNPNTPILSTLTVKNYVMNGVNNRSQLIELKSDIEVYIGIYLIAVWFIGWSSFLTIMMYWQVLRLRYMINAHS